MIVNFIDLKKQYKNIGKDIGKEFIDIMTNAQFVGGEILDRFERNFADYNGAKHAVGVGSGTDALWLSLVALGIGRGDEVIVPTNTFIATAFAVSQAGATPVFVDADPYTYNISLSDIEAAITNKTEAVIPVHLYGMVCDMTAIIKLTEKYNLKIIEDNAQSIGATWKGQKSGTLGDCGAFSFYPTKNLGGLGQGGAVLTDDEKIADKIRSLGNVGRSKDSRDTFEYVGFNSRLDTINALFLNTLLEGYLDRWILARQKNAFVYNEQLKDIKEVVIPVVRDNATHVYHLYQLKCFDRKIRDSLKQYLEKKNISTGVYYPIPCHKQRMYKKGTVHNLLVAEELAKTLLALPMHPCLTEEEIQYVCDCVKEFFVKQK